VREDWLGHRQMIEEMWAEGMTAREIGEAIGTTSRTGRVNIGRYRSRGYNLPHRRTPEQIARMTADKGAHLAKAREVWRAQRDTA
jgi:transposase